MAPSRWRLWAACSARPCSCCPTAGRSPPSTSPRGSTAMRRRTSPASCNACAANGPACLLAPPATAGARLDITAQAGCAFPGPVDPSSIFAPGQITPDWHAIALKAGGTLDPANVPLDHHTEDLLQLLHVGGHAELHNQPENYRVQ